MLLVFAFSITPQKSIHDIVAKHVDPSTCNVHHKAPIEQVEKSSIHCSFDQLVATTPFIHYCFSITIPTPQVAAVRNTTLAIIYDYSIANSNESRGPPAA